MIIRHGYDAALAQSYDRTLELEFVDPVPFPCTNQYGLYYGQQTCHAPPSSLLPTPTEILLGPDVNCTKRWLYKMASNSFENVLHKLLGKKTVLRVPTAYLCPCMVLWRGGGAAHNLDLDSILLEASDQFKHSCLSNTGETGHRQRFADVADQPTWGSLTADISGYMLFMHGTEFSPGIPEWWLHFS